jgi:hypothetical protein
VKISRDSGSSVIYTNNTHTFGFGFKEILKGVIVIRHRFYGIIRVTGLLCIPIADSIKKIK